MQGLGLGSSEGWCVCGLVRSERHIDAKCELGVGRLRDAVLYVQTVVSSVDLACCLGANRVGVATRDVQRRCA